MRKRTAMSLSKAAELCRERLAATALSPELVTAIERMSGAIQWPASRMLHQGGDGWTYLICTRRGDFTLRIWPGKAIESVRNEDCVLRAIASAGVAAQPPFALVMACPDGSTAALRPYVVGATPETLSLTHIESIGRLLAVLHSLDVPAGFQTGLHPWPAVDNVMFLRDLADSDPALAHVSAAVADRIVREDIAMLPKAVIHDDVSLGNLVVQLDETMVLIDWSDAHLDTAVSDLAVASRQLGLTFPARQRMIAAYQEVRPAAEDELAAIALLEARRELFILHYERTIGSPITGSRVSYVRDECMRLLETP